MPSLLRPAAMRALAAAAALLALLAAPLAEAAAGGGIRGLDPALAPRYQPKGGMFTCLDGKKTIPFGQVNDDYCDCADGSDEPGTSACPTARFYCANQFFLPLLLNASMVDDGVCDCCDGSDEPAGKCEDTCFNKGMVALIDLKEEVKAADAGLAARDKYISEAAATKAKWAERKAALGGELAGKTKERDAAQAERDKLEEQLKKLRDERAGLEEKREKLAAAQQAEPAGAAGEEQQPAGEEGAEGGLEEHEHVVQAVAAEGLEGEEQIFEAEEEPADGAAEAAEADAAAAEVAAGGDAAARDAALAEERMAQWIPGSGKPNDGEGEGSGGEEEDVAAAGDGGDQSFLASGAADVGSHDGGDAGDGGGDAGAEAAEGVGGGAAAEEEEQPTTAVGKARALVRALWGALTGTGTGALAKLNSRIAGLDKAIGRLDRQLEPVRSRASEGANAVRDLEKEEADLSKKLGAAYGEQDVFVGLVDRCFSTKVDKYTYEVCPFGKATQKEGAHGGGTSLGAWEGLSHGDTVMAFRGGQACWQGPARSITVSLRCAVKERLSHVDEPNRCEYTAELETPAVCTPAAATALKAELQRRQRLLEGPKSGGGEGARDEL